jgi:zinc finger BED domain-containing protein 1 (E3 SUMO-protein ligase ZBED1)
MSLKPKKLTLDTKTRWGSTYKMLKRLMNNRPAISAALAVVKGTKKPPPGDLNSNEWALLSSIMNVLKPIHEATKLFSHQKTPMISSVVPVVCRIIFFHLKTNEREDEVCAEFKKVIREDLSKRWKHIIEDISDVLLLAVYFDIRLKDFSFIENETKRRDCLEEAKQLCSQLLSNPETILSQGTIVTTTQGKDDAQKAEEERLNSLYGPLAKNNSEIEEFEKNELEQYHLKKAKPFCIGTHVIDPLEWWKKHTVKFEKLSKLARRFLCIIATSLPCERTYSKSGFIVNKRRACLSDNVISNLVFISQNV